jgi:VanZ family protein
MALKQNRLSSAAISKLLLTGFVLALLTATHLPPNALVLPVEVNNIDKVFHFTAYAILAGLLATSWQLSSGILTSRHLRWVWCAVAIFGALDELTQIAVGRDCSIWDWSADAVGAACGLLAFVWLRRRFIARATEAQ